MGTTLNIDFGEPRRNGSNSAEPRATAKELDWLARALLRGRTERFTEIVLVTPGLAAAMLAYNIGNRPLRAHKIALHVARLKRGDFVLHHHGIAFAKTNVLNDGQHRLKAIVVSGIPGLMQITFGAEREEFDVIDQCHPRSAGDLLVGKGANYTNLRASVARALLQSKEKTRVSDAQQILEHAIFLRGNIMNEALAFASSMSQHKVCPPTAAAVAYYIIATKTKKSERLPFFIKGLATGEALNGIKLNLREWLIKGKTEARTGDLRSTQFSAAIIYAWNSFLTGRRKFETTWNHVLSYPEPL